MSKPLVIMATEFEAKGFLSSIPFTKISKNFYTHSQCDLLISGMGCLQASLNTQKILEHSWLINAGFSGTFGTHPLGEIVEIGKVDKYLLSTSSFAHQAFPTLNLGDTDHHLLTSDWPLYSTSKNIRAHFVDMEGYGIAYLANLHGIPCTLIKIVSDHVNSCTSSTIRKHGAALSEKLALSLKQKIIY